MTRRHRERHLTRRIGWLRAAVLGANDGVISTASLILGVATAHGGRAAVLTAGLAGLVAGTMSMAAGEFVSVSSQADLESAEIENERRELEVDHVSEHKELAGIYVKRGLTQTLANEVATQLMEHDALDAHLRDELGISETHKARPLQAAVASALSYASGAVLPLLSAALLPQALLIPLVSTISLVVLVALGAAAARAGGASVIAGALRVSFWGALAMGITAGTGALFGAIG